MGALFQFVMRSGPTPGTVYALEGDQLIIGRDSSHAVAINDAEVSRKHARLTFQGGKYVLEDLGSTNGTFVNGQRLTSAAVLKSGDVVSFGEQIVLMFESLSADVGATVISHKPLRPAPAPVPVPAPAPAPVPQQYAAAPAPAVAPSGAKPARKMLIFIIIGAIALVCLCIVLGLYIDNNYLWCPVSFNLIPGCK